MSFILLESLECMSTGGNYLSFKRVSTSVAMFYQIPGKKKKKPGCVCYYYYLLNFIKAMK